MHPLRFLALPCGAYAQLVVTAERFDLRSAGALLLNPNSHFLGEEVELAGNFFRWRTILKLLSDETVRRQLAVAIGNDVELLADNPRKKALSSGCTVEYGAPVGWSITATASRFHEAELRPIKLRSNATVMTIKPELRVPPAPLTSLVTIRYTIATKDGRWRVMVSNAYPGQSLGRIRGDLTAREGLVLIPPILPGEPRP